MNRLVVFVVVVGVLVFTNINYNVFAENKGVVSFNTGYTISNIRTAKVGSSEYIVANSYEGTILGIDVTGKVLWKNELSGFMNHDIWCHDITGDGNDEILAANADGSIYCLSDKGKLMWKFKPNEAPMNSVCVIRKDDKLYVVCGGYDKNIYYLSPMGKLMLEIPSSSYSHENPWQPYNMAVPDSTCHTANFIRRVIRSDGSEALVVHGINHTMAIQARGSLYLFEPMEKLPYKTIDLIDGRPMGELRCADINGDGADEIMMGTSTLSDWTMLRIDPQTGVQTLLSEEHLKNQIIGFGYRVLQPECVTVDGEKKYFILLGSQIILLPLNMEGAKAEVLSCKYSFNDMWYDGDNHRILLASAQSGGSCVHLINLNDPNWKKAYTEIEPSGKIAEILKNTNLTRENLHSFKVPVGEHKPHPVYLMSESIPKSVVDLVDSIKTNCPSPVFLNSAGTNRAENWDRSSLANEAYRQRRDNRRKYDATSDDIVNTFVPHYNNGSGIAFWGGHGNDPYMFQLSTIKRILDEAKGKKTVLIYPELEDHSDDFGFVMDDYFYPLANYCRDKNGRIYVRTKSTFWEANVYLPMWSKLLSGQYANVFIPAMEETTDKSMELSLAARLGIWASGATDSWGSRCARDNASFDRMRQHSNQMLPNHFLRMMICHISSGAQYIDNFSVDQKYMSLLWDLIAKGVLFVPESRDIVSFSPVHLSMLNPDEHYLEESNNVKWTTFYDQNYEEKTPYVFSRLNGTWPGAPVTNWDFSRYAAGVKERRLNFLPPYSNGLVLITPPQDGAFADKNAPRGAMTNHMNPIYKNILREYYTDGRYYYSADGKQKYNADEYYKVIETDIKKSANLLPLTVSGEVAWVVAQTSPTHLRLTIIDGGYINPSAKTAKITFHTVTPVKMVDLLDEEHFNISNSSSVQVNIPCGLFRFIDIELKKPL